MEKKISRTQSRKIILVLIANYLGAFGWGLFAPLFALIVVNRGGDPAQVGALWGAFTVLTGILMIVFGRLEDKQHRIKTYLNGGVILLTLATVLLIVLNNLAGIVIAQIIFGIGFGMSSPALKTLYGKLLESGHEAQEWAFMDGGNNMIMGVAALSGGLIYQYGSEDSLYWLMLAAFSVSAITYFLVVKTISKK